MTKFSLSLLTALVLGSAACSNPDGIASNKAAPSFEAMARQGGGQQRPDLVISKVSHTPANPVAGETVNFSVTVSNIGNRSTPTDTIIGVGIYAGNGPAVAFSSNYRKSLAPGASVVVTTNSPWTALEGANSLRVVVDDVNRIAERNESNNEFAHSVQVAPNVPKVPDLTVTTVSFSPEHPVAGETVSFKAVVKNVGIAPTPAGSVLSVGFKDAGGARIAASDTHTSELLPNESVELTTNKTWTAVEGSQKITAHVDDQNSLTESNEDNNTLVVDIVVDAPAAPPVPDLVVTDFTFSPSAPKDGDEVTFTATVKNVGTGPTPEGVVLGVGMKNDQPGAIAFSDTHTASLPAGSSIQLTTNKTWVAVEGTHDIVAHVDDVNRITELDETNNTLTKQLTAGPKAEIGLPDLVVVDFSHSPAAPQEGDTVTFTATVKNAGTASVPTGVVLGVGFQTVAGPAVAFSDTHTSGLAPGATVKLTTNQSWTSNAGSHTVTAHVDDVNRVEENDEGNNRLAKTVTVAAKTTSPAPTNAKPAYSFIDSVGVNTHFAFTSTNYGNSNYPKVRDRLLELGVKHIRDGSMSASAYKAGTRSNQIWNELATYGIKLNMIGRYNWTATDIIDVLNANKASIISIEGQNEPDIFVDGDWVTLAVNFQKLLWKTVNGSAYAHIPVLTPSLAQPSRYPMLGDLSGYGDYGNVHSYNGGRDPAINIENHLTQVKPVSGNLPVMSTETGYHTALQTNDSHLPISERGFAKYMTRLYFHYFNRGIARTYQYQFYDHIAPSTTNKEANFGLVRYDYSVRQAFTNLKNTLAILKDNTATIPGGTLNYSLSGSTANVKSTLLQKSNGKFYLVLWQQVSVWDRTARKDIVNPDVSVTVNFGATKSTAYYKPSASATPLSTQSGSSVTISVPDEIVILEIQ
jgi:subtilase family serine protease